MRSVPLGSKFLDLTLFKPIIYRSNIKWSWPVRDLIWRVSCEKGSYAIFPIRFVIFKRDIVWIKYIVRFVVVAYCSYARYIYTRYFLFRLYCLVNISLDLYFEPFNANAWKSDWSIVWHKICLNYPCNYVDNRVLLDTIYILVFIYKNHRIEQ